jgi:acetyl esterase/lipase
MMNRLFMLHAEDIEAKVGREIGFDNFVTALLGGSATEIPETYRNLSPIYHVGVHCPPTLLLHGSDDVFGLTPGVRRLYRVLQEANITAILVEFPHCEHAFDLILPQVSAVAMAATHDVERFLAFLV